MTMSGQVDTTVLTHKCLVRISQASVAIIVEAINERNKLHELLGLRAEYCTNSGLPTHIK